MSTELFITSLLQNKVIKHGKVREETYHRMFIPFTVPCTEPILFNTIDMRLFCDAKEMLFILLDAVNKTVHILYGLITIQP